MREQRLIKIDKNKVKRFKWELALFNTYTLFGILFVSISILGSFFLIRSYNEQSFILNWEDTFVVRGKIIKLEKSGYGYGSEVSSKPIYRFKYIYQIDNKDYFNVDFSEHIKYKDGDSINIHVKKNDHAISKIDGFKKSPFGISDFVIILLPFFGLYPIIEGIRKSRYLFSIINNGIYTTGVCVKSIETDEEENDCTIFEHYIEYYDFKDKKYFKPMPSTIKKLKPKVELIYKVTRPSSMIILENLNVFNREQIMNYCR